MEYFISANLFSRRFMKVENKTSEWRYFKYVALEKPDHQIIELANIDNTIERKHQGF